MAISKNILLCGFFGEGNLGDEAILQAIYANLPESIEPIITSGYKQTFGKSIRRRGLLSWPSFLIAASKSPVTVFTGGILQDWSWEGVTFFANRIIAAARMGSIPVLFGAGIGPLRSEKAKETVKKALSYVKAVYVRDQTSYDIYRSLMPEADVKLGTDWTWHFRIPRKDLDSKNSMIAVNLRQWGQQKIIDDAIMQINSFEGTKIGLAARKGDIKLLEGIQDMTKVSCPPDFISFAKACNDCTHGVAMRYHAALAMLRSGLKTKLVCYDDKVKYLADSIGATQNKNGISFDFNAPPDDFLETNSKLFEKMKISFIDLIKSLY